MSEYELQIDKPVKEVYRVFKDPDNMPHWLTGFQRMEPISGTPGEVGSKSRQIYLERGKTVELIETITAHVPEKHFAGTIEGPGINVLMEIDFIAKGDDCTILRWRANTQSQGFMMSLMMPFIRGKVHERQVGDLHKFKRLVEEARP
jgi:uncharacterized membrane protein